MRVFRPLPKPFLAALATLFAAAAILYSGLWIFSASRPIPVELGFDNKYLPATHAQLVQSVVHGSPAERAGMKPGDRIIGINGGPLEEDSLIQIWSQHKPGDTVELSIARPGVSSPIVLHGTFRASGPASAEAGVVGYLGRGINSLFPVVFVTVGLAVLFLRLEDPHAWLMALMFGGFIAIPGFANSFLGVPSSLRPLAIVYRAIFNNMVAAFFFFFFATFPTRSTLDRRLPWLKWLGLLIGATLALPALLRSSGSGVTALGLPSSGSGHISILCFNYGLIVLGFISLISNAMSTASSEARRKIRVILWGTLVGVIPATLALAANDFFGFNITLWMGAALILLLWLFPVSFAYAVVKHRVLEIPVLLKRSARYLLVQRGFTVLLGLSIGATLIFASSTRYFRPLIDVAQPAGIAVGAVFGTMLLWAGAQLHKRVSVRIDRAFFRSAYDARVILEDLAEKTRASTDRGELARLLEHHLKEALQPTSLAVYLQASDNGLTTASDAVSKELRTIPVKLPILTELAQRGQPWEFPPTSEDAAEKSGLEALHPECLVPVMGRGDRMVGLLVMGPRLSEGPYSGEDKRLLASIAGQAGTALENICLAGEIADRIEAERWAAREMEIAKEVQARLLPQEPPRLKTLDCAAQCLEARSVGGDYYDFLDLGRDRVGFVLADVSGKGVHAALLMANLQAYLRSQSAITPLEPTRLLQQVNRMLWKATSSEHFATLFFAIYDDSSHQMSYINCGHNPPVWLRQNRSVQRLPATATVIGVFEQWECFVDQIRLAPGDLLVIFSDGVTEAARNEEEYGEARLIHELQACRHLPVNEIVEAIFASVQEFSAGAQSDDLTLVIVKARP